MAVQLYGRSPHASDAAVATGPPGLGACRPKAKSLVQGALRGRTELSALPPDAPPRIAERVRNRTTLPPGLPPPPPERLPTTRLAAQTRASDRNTELLPLVTTMATAVILTILFTSILLLTRFATQRHSDEDHGRHEGLRRLGARMVSDGFEKARTGCACTVHATQAHGAHQYALRDACRRRRACAAAASAKVT